MTAADASRVWRVVWARLGEWEADSGIGSARPVFDAAWTDATAGLAEPATPHEREVAWRTWLERGHPLTPARAAALLADAETRAHDGALFAGSTLRRLRREPGQEG